MENTCKTCAEKTDGYKCDMCGAESKEHDANHGCGGGHCMPKCSNCQKAEERCKC